MVFGVRSTGRVSISRVPPRICELPNGRRVPRNLMEAGAVQETRGAARAVSSSEAVQFIESFLQENDPSKTSATFAMDEATANQLQRVVECERENATAATKP